MTLDVGQEISYFMKNKKIIVILGPTASGKTKLGAALAAKFGGEIISADSRQVYRGMDIGTGKDLAEYTVKKKKEALKIPYHLIDVASPRTEFNLAKFQKLARAAIADVLKRGRLPLIVGGSGLYLEALADGYDLQPVKPDKKLRKELEKKTAAELFLMLKDINSKFAQRLNESEQKNKRRLIRYLEIVRAGQGRGNKTSRIEKDEFFLLGLNWPREVLKERIYKRLIERLEKEDLIGEVRELHQAGLSWKRLNNFGLEYKFVSWHLRGKLSYGEMAEKLNIAIRQFAKRQMSWFRRWERRGGKIYWVKNKEEAERLVKKFLK